VSPQSWECIVSTYSARRPSCCCRRMKDVSMRRRERGKARFLLASQLTRNSPPIKYKHLV
jgi:hypothetical protein